MAKFVKVMGTDLAAIRTNAKRQEAQILTISRKQDISAQEFIKTLTGKETVYRKLILMKLSTFRGNIEDWRIKFKELLSIKVG